MARIRTIKPDIWEDRKIGKCSLLARLNFQGLISLADDEGRGQGDLKWLMGRLHAFQGGLTEDSMSESLTELEATGSVVFYEADGERFYWLRNFLKHQRINRPTPSRIPAYSRKAHGGLIEESVKAHGGLTTGRDGNGADGSGVERSGQERIISPGEGGSDRSASAPLTTPRGTTRAKTWTPEEIERERQRKKQILEGLPPDEPDPNALIDAQLSTDP